MMSQLADQRLSGLKRRFKVRGRHIPSIKFPGILTVQQFHFSLYGETYLSSHASNKSIELHRQVQDDRHLPFMVTGVVL